MFNFLRDLWDYHWRFFLSRRIYNIMCWKCQKPMSIKARRPRMDDYGPVASARCRCGEENVVSYHCHAIVGFGRPMPEATRLKRDSSTEI